MGNYNTRSIRFRQSINDFPLTVQLGEKCPSWGLSRWRGNSGLKFIPPDDEAFSLRGDKWRLLYKGQRRSHRFTILGDSGFEYDCILNKEPESNVISLRMEGVENYDFFKQPDFVKDDFLKGSFAVYKKETLVGEGTGKLCHIHRPEITDARGRRCWGELTVVGNVLRITIPANWLSEAKYPVVVDPAIGTTTKGSLTNYNLANDTAGTTALSFNKQIAVSRFYTDMKISGTCVGYGWANATGVTYTTAGYPLIYSNNSGVPGTKLSSNEQLINLNLLPGYVSGFKSAEFNVGNINSNSYLFYGISSDQAWYPRFDMGDTFYYQSWSGNPTPNAFPANATVRSLKLSMYFTFEGNYTRKLTQGVTLSDSRKRKSDITRKTAQTVNAEAEISRLQGFVRFFIETATGFDIASRFETISRKCFDTVANTITLGRFPVFMRNVKETIGLLSGLIEKLHFSRKCNDSAGADVALKLKLSFIRKVDDLVYGIDNHEFAVLFYRSLTDTTAVTQTSQGIRGFYRALKTNVNNFDSLTPSVDFFRVQSESIFADSSLFRKLDILVRIVTKVLVWEHFLGRFLKSKSEIVIKSCITRELTLESKIN